MSILRIANCSGFYGDRLSAAREMVEGGPIDVLTGDYLAELTLAILQRDRAADPRLGYAKTFPLQLRQIAETCLARGIRIVVNAGGLNPAGCADACRAVYDELGLDARVAHVEGDDLLPRLDALRAAGERFEHLDRGVALATLEREIVSANAYLGGWGIARALSLGADLVVCPRVTDASLVVGPAAWRFGWGREDWDRLASAVVAGHVLECGAQATGGNYAFFGRVEGLEHPGFPIAEIAGDGSFTVTKHPGTGGAVTIGTVTAQLLYEIGGPRYENPDVTALFDTIRLEQTGEDRVRVDGVRGEPPPPATKVCINYLGGFQNRVTFLLTGLDVARKAELVEQTLWRRLGGRESFAETRVTLHRAAAGESFETSFSFLTVAVKDPDPEKVGRRFSGAAVELALASYPGFNLTAPPGKPRPYGVYWPALVSTDAVAHRVLFEGKTHDVAPTPGVAPPPDAGRAPLATSRRTDAAAADGAAEVQVPASVRRASNAAAGAVPASVRRAPLGRICGARSGDKGGNANLGVWVETDAAYAWLRRFLTVERLRALVPEARDLGVDRYELPNLRALNFVLRGFLGDGVAASLAVDAQAKGLGEYLRAKEAPIPASLLDSSPPSAEP